MGNDRANITHLSRLLLLVQRFLDAEVLSEREAAALLGEIAAARQSLAAGRAEAARGHLNELARLARALVEAGALAPADGTAVIGLIEAAGRVLNPATDAAPDG